MRRNAGDVISQTQRVIRIERPRQAISHSTGRRVDLEAETEAPERRLTCSAATGRPADCFACPESPVLLSLPEFPPDDLVLFAYFDVLVILIAPSDESAGSG